MAIFEEFKFQEEGIAQLTEVTKDLLSYGKVVENGVESARRVVFKSPTGSGKTIMMGKYFKKLIEEEAQGWTPNAEYLFVWISLNDLHIQSMRKIAKVVGNSYTIKSLDTLTNSPFEKNTILFANWQSLKTKKKNELGIAEWANKAVKKGESGTDLGSLVEKTKDKVGKNVEVILIIDEAHTHLTKQADEFIKEILDPTLIIEVTATPQHEPTHSETESKEWGYVRVPFAKVVNSGLIKKKTVISPDIDKYNSEDLTDIEVLLEAAYHKRLRLLELYKEIGSDINPLILVQLPSGESKVTASDTTVKESVEEFFKTKGITRDNGKLAAWLSDDKENKENIEANDNEVEVLIFKVAIAQGTDIPRSSILVMLRDIASVTLEIQTVGRVLRMPEAKHYQNDELNTAYLYTNINDVGIKDQEAMDFFSQDSAVKKDEIEEIYLPTAISERIDSVQLDIRFEKILFKKLLEHFRIKFEYRNGTPVVIEDPESIYNKIDNNPENQADNGLELYVDELAKKSKVGIDIDNIDEVAKYIGNPPRTEIDMNSAMPLVRNQYFWLTRAWLSPYLSGRGVIKLHNVLRRFFLLCDMPEEFMQRAIALSSNNQRILSEIVQLAKDEFVTMDVKETGGLRRSFGEAFFTMDKTMRVPHSYSKREGYKKYAYQPCFVPKDFNTELGFEKDILESREDIIWWYKNPSASNSSLGIKYSYIKPRNEEDGTMGGYTEAIFRPDYIVMFKDGTIGIYDTKSFGTKDSEETKGKANALSAYIQMLESNKVKADGGIVDAGSKSYRVFRGEDYSAVTTNSGWEDFDKRNSAVQEGKQLKTLDAFETQMRKLREPKGKLLPGEVLF